MTKSPTHLHFIIQAYSQKLDDGSLIDCQTLDLLAETATEALDRAKVLLDRPYNRISQVIEHIDGQPCGKS